MISARSAFVKDPQPAISGSVLRHPTQRPLAPSTIQIRIQGEAIMGAGSAMALDYHKVTRKSQDYVQVIDVYDLFLI
jgi:hypothetical protein